MTPVQTPRSPVSTVLTSFDILEYMKRVDGATLEEMTEEFELAKSTAHRHLKTLQYREYITQEGKEYYISTKFVEFGEYVTKRKKGFVLVEAKVKELAEETEERVQFIVEEHGMGVYLYRETGDKAIKTDPGVGKRVHLHSTATGKAILAYLPDEQVNSIFETRGLPQITGNTKISPESLYDEFREIRKNGYSINVEENMKGLNAIGSPVRDSSGHVLGALGISGPSHRLKEEKIEEELSDLLLGTVNELELNIKHK